MVHQPGSQIRLGFDLSDFGVQEPQRQQRFHTNPTKKVQAAPQPQFDYFERLDVPKIYLQNEQQYRIIKNKQKTRPSERDLELERLRQLVRKHDLEKKQVVEEVQQEKRRSTNPKKVVVEVIKKDTKALKKFRSKVRVLLCMLKFVDLYKNTLQSMIQKKRELMEKQYKDNFKEGNEMLVDWLDDIMTEFQQELVNTSESLQMQEGQGKKNAIIKKKLASLLQLIKLNGDFKPGTVFVGSLAKIFNLMIQSYSFPPKSVYTIFEMKRLPTTHLGSLGNMDQKHQKMILIIQILIKQVIFTNIYKILEVVGGQIQNKESQLLIQKNAQILVSIMHELLVKWMEANVKEQQNYKLDILSTQFKYAEKPLSIKKSQTSFPDGVLIEGIIPSSIIQKYIVDNNGKIEQWVQRFLDDLLAFIDNVLKQLNKVYSSGLGKRERITQMMFNSLIN